MMGRTFLIEPDGLPDLPAMMLVTLGALRDLGGSANINELDEKILELEGVTEAEQAIPMKGDDPRLRANYYLAWARTFLRRGGAIENSARGIWNLTSQGSTIENNREQARNANNL
ncbi:hypothetical protein DD557_02445 [Thalassobacter stenotrophicus]|uniref:Restriction system protein Mrr-like N-terminal domain-containing protein n=3 Tax=Thalassobacter stenotrophicus TaxID=266809 RepID=A0A0P1FJY5_9RHOB|nr:hypothetical protein DD557_02445 [Thalassobacter stenotrophicus]CUH60505.1 hypothetical protein THS5294_01800 [Thalassobacter stenotrophicus]SHI77005.1 Mrr N-terminal domain-containing protein [Thalassobacter stenotrophicus DSM 16310]